MKHGASGFWSMKGEEDVIDKNMQCILFDEVLEIGPRCDAFHGIRACMKE